LIAPRSVVPESIMPNYSHLATTPLEFEYIEDDLIANRWVGVPYTEEMIENARRDLVSQANPDGDFSDSDAMQERYGDKAQARDFDGDPSRITEMDAMVAYLQMLGTLVDFTDYEPGLAANRR